MNHIEDDNHPHDKYMSEPSPADLYFDYGPSLPEKYDQDAIFLMIHDPKCIFAYWEISGPIARKMVRDSDSQNWHWVLRVHNLTANSTDDFKLDKPANYSNVQGNYYIPVLPDNQYRVELGVFKNKEFTPLVESNTVQAPRLGTSPLTDVSSYT